MDFNTIVGKTIRCHTVHGECIEGVFVGGDSLYNFALNDARIVACPSPTGGLPVEITAKELVIRGRTILYVELDCS
jgi:small nuclear ribonucleoprotein (snRNP)-like protein